MKRILYLLIVILSLTLLVSCSKKEDDNDKTPNIEEVLSKIVLKDATFVYDGNNKSLKCENVPDYLYDFYEGNNQKEIGSYTITAKIFDEDANLLLTLTATLKIVLELEETDDGLENIVFSDTTFNYDGTAKSITALNVPANIRVEYEGNEQINEGIYTVTAKFYDENNELVLEKTATLKITKTVDVILPLV